MAASSVPPNPTSHQVASLLPKLSDADSDIRYMTLNDLSQMMINGHATFIAHDYITCAKVVDGLLATLNDSHGEVQNMAIKCLGPFVTKAPESILCPTIEKVSTVRIDNAVDSSIPALAVRAIVVALPHPLPGIPRSPRVLEAYNAVSKALIPRLVGKIVIPLAGAKTNPAPPVGMLRADIDTGEDSNSLDLLTEVAKCYGPMLQEAEVEALEQVTMQVLESERCGTVLKKKAVGALTALALHFTDALLAKHVSYSIQRLRESHLTNQQRKLYLTVYGSLARSIPQKFGPYLKTLAPFVLAPLSQQELEQQQEAEAENDGERDVEAEDVREAALVAIESFLEACSQDMRAFAKDVVESTTRFLKYEPNVADDDDEDMDEEEPEEDAFEGEEDFEEETGFEDEDDVSWKVRRTSAKALRALIGMLDVNDPIMYSQVAPALIARFKEREESVRGEIIAALSFLITKTGLSSAAQFRSKEFILPQSRKRRRGFSDSLTSETAALHGTTNGYASPSTPPPVDSATQGLAKINPEVIKGSAKLLKTSTAPTKQAIISLLKCMVIAQGGGLSEHADLVIDPVIEAINGSNSMSSAAGNAFKIEALALLRVVAEMHSSKILQPHLEKIVSALIVTAKDRYARVSSEAFETIEAFVKALTPPRSTAKKAQNADVLAKLYQVIIDRISAQDADTEVRQNAVRALGLLIGRTSGTSGSALLSQQDRFAGQQLLIERLKNELTRLACVRAIEVIAILAQTKKDYKSDFVGTVSLELSAQLRKASRSLRGASLSALKVLALNTASRDHLTDDVVAGLVEMLVPLLTSEDLHMIGPALIVLAAFAKDRAQLVSSEKVTAGICTIIRSNLSGAALDALMMYVDAVGRAGAGKNLMSALLQISPVGDTDVTGQIIGTLLVSGGTSVGVGLDAFVKELSSQEDDTKRCLALAVIGEAALRMGMKCPLSVENMLPYFDDPSEKVKLAAAAAIGRAGAGNVKAYLPKILTELSQGKQYLLLHSVKELLQHSNAEDDVRPYTKKLWDNIISSGQAEDNKVVGAECVGRLAIIDPPAYLPQLQTYLQNPNATIRGMVISSLRYVFADTEESYNANLQATIIPMLSTMLGDADLDNQRSALSTFNSSLQNKPDLVLPHLAELLPFAINASIIRADLIREVSMGPFKHKVDDGLEMRKAAYETLYALLDSPASRQRLNVPVFYDRIVAGIADEHEIKILCCLVLGKLLAIEPAESTRRLDSLAQQFRTVLTFKSKDNAVKQELEKVTENNKAIIKVSVLFQKAMADVDNRVWKEYFDYVKRDHASLLKSAEEELRSGER